MQSGVEQGKYALEMKALLKLCGDAIGEEELKKQLEESNGNVSMVIEKLVAKFMNPNVCRLHYKPYVHAFAFCKQQNSIPKKKKKKKIDGKSWIKSKKQD
ncbi:hypothetical protein RFI_39205 [Reticulomyxa filosa]|uniref:Uncharacterized protein n=1 Tax=Reticulomyxa filosa TaxID=46433 RepID=X6LAZ6_RETFI|nr:hypothetical protein RFI_39205 [Reticulomyxa filosa]|eukprot:ETN98306.1 hypothetical protein RFI_39205 [Reticulomyxa filosa]